MGIWLMPGSGPASRSSRAAKVSSLSRAPQFVGRPIFVGDQRVDQQLLLLVVSVCVCVRLLLC